MRKQSRSSELAIIQVSLGAILAVGVIWFLWPYLPYAVGMVLVFAGVMAALYVRRHHLHNDRVLAEIQTIRAEAHRLTESVRLKQLEIDNAHVRHIMNQQATQGRVLALAAPEVVEADYPATDVLDLCNQGKFKPTALGEFLATGMTLSGSLAHIPLGNAGHMALAGSTGNGKTNAMRWILAQLVAVPAWSVHYISPAYARRKANGEDWTDIHRLLSSKVSRSGPEIQDRLSWGVGELARRMDAEERGDLSWSKERIYIAIDEYKEVVARCKDAPEYIGTLLRMGRQYEIFVIVSAQDFLIKNIGGDSGARDSYSTVLYFGGDPTTCRSLLGDTVDEAPLVGNGYCYMKGRGAYGKPVLLRLPYASNEGIDMITRSFHDKKKDPINVRPIDTTPALHDERYLVEEMGRVAEVLQFVKAPPDKELAPDQVEEFTRLYEEHKSIKKTLRAMKIGNAYYSAAQKLLNK